MTAGRAVRRFPAPNDAAAAVRAGREALAHRRWEDARERFEAALESGETAEALEGLGNAIERLGDVLGSLVHRERAYLLFRRSGAAEDAARVAISVGLVYASERGEYAVANGWFRRARGLLEALEPGTEHARLAIWEAHLAFIHHDDVAAAREQLDRGLTLARSLDLEEYCVVGLGLEGLLLVAEGRVGDGMARLDEATTAAVAGELSDPDAMGNTCCYALRACEQVQDFERAAQWLARVAEFNRRVRIPLFVTYCRNHYVAILTWRGAYAEAEAELEAVVREAGEQAPTVLPEVDARLGELRRRQGRHAEAAACFARAEAHPLAALGRAALALDQDDPRSAVELVRRFLRRLPGTDRISRGPAWPLLVSACCALGEHEDAAEALAELRALAEAAPTEALQAAHAAAEGTLALCAGDAEAAGCSWADAVYRFERAGAPYETAAARLGLARAQLALGRRADAEDEARAALAAYERLGAAGEAARAAGLLARIAAPTEGADSAGGAASEPPDPLTRRQVEVVRLVALGLSNKEIGARLFLSELTVKRHVADILTRLDLPSRAAAAAYAAQRGLC